MKIWNKAVGLLIGTAVFLSGCKSTDNMISESTGNSTTEVTSTTTETTTAENAHPITKIPFLRKKIEEINEADKEMEQQGFHALKTICFIYFTQDEDPYEPIETVKIDKNRLEATAVVRIEEGDFDGHSDFGIYAFMTINGKVVDFSLDGKSSKDGILTSNMQSNEDHIIRVSAEDLPADKGENEISLAFFGYSKSRDMYIDYQYSRVRFTSDHKESGKVIEVCPEDKINVVTYRDRDKISSSSYFVSPEEQLDFESDHYGYTKVTTVPSPTMHFQIDNVSTEGIIGNRSGLLLFFIDGELKPVWNGSYIGEISLEERELIKEIIMTSEFKPGEEHNIRWYYMETHGVSEWPVSNWFSVHLAIREQ